jgi:hypothetical protein
MPEIDPLLAAVEARSILDAHRMNFWGRCSKCRCWFPCETVQLVWAHLNKDS